MTRFARRRSIPLVVDGSTQRHQSYPRAASGRFGSSMDGGDLECRFTTVWLDNYRAGRKCITLHQATLAAGRFITDGLALATNTDISRRLPAQSGIAGDSSGNQRAASPCA